MQEIPYCAYLISLFLITSFFITFFIFINEAKETKDTLTIGDITGYGLLALMLCPFIPICLFSEKIGKIVVYKKNSCKKQLRGYKRS